MESAITTNARTSYSLIIDDEVKVRHAIFEVNFHYHVLIFSFIFYLQPNDEDTQVEDDQTVSSDDGKLNHYIRCLISYHCIPKQILLWTPYSI